MVGVFIPFIHIVLHTYEQLFPSLYPPSINPNYLTSPVDFVPSRAFPSIFPVNRPKSSPSFKVTQHRLNQTIRISISHP